MNKDEKKLYNQKYYITNKEKLAEYSRQYHLDNLYNISVEQYDQMFADQNGCCAICNCHQDQFKNALAVDHDHNTGAVRELLCHSCNTYVGRVENNYEYTAKVKNPKLISRAKQYIEKHNGK